MTTLVEISKRGPRLTAEQREEQKRNRTQARVGLASNVVGLGAGAAGLYGAAKVPELWKKKGAEIAATPAKTVTGRAKWVAGGLLGLQAANLGGDVVANRVLARSAAKPEGKVKKSAGKVAGATAATTAAGAAGAAALRHVGEGARAGVAAEQAAKKGRRWLVPVAVTGAAGAGGGGALVLSRRKRRREDELVKADGEFMLDAYISKADHTGGHGSIEKAYRRADPEADRQRRLGLAAGTGVGGAAVLGSLAARNYTTRLALREGGDHVKGIGVRPKKGKAAVLLTGGALASGGLGAAAYRRGISERNNPWN